MHSQRWELVAQSMINVTQKQLEGGAGVDARDERVSRKCLEASTTQRGVRQLQLFSCARFLHLGCYIETPPPSAVPAQLSRGQVGQKCDLLPHLPPLCADFRDVEPALLESWFPPTPRDCLGPSHGRPRSSPAGMQVPLPQTARLLSLRVVVSCPYCHPAALASASHHFLLVL
jgi:hypothetical protein